MTIKKEHSLSRREFLISGITAAALIVPVRLAAAVTDGAVKTSEQINIFVIVEPDNKVTVLTPFVEMGQGVHTAIPMLVAEELDVPLSQINLQEAPLEPGYRLHFGGAMRYTGSSLTIADAFIPFRTAGAEARALLIQSAAHRWGVRADDLATSQGYVIHRKTGKKTAYGELLPIPSDVRASRDIALKKKSKFEVIGKPTGRLDAAEKSNGSAIYGIDIAPPGTLVATVKQSPVLGGRILHANTTEAASMPGVVDIAIIPNGTYSIRDYALAPPEKIPDETLGSIAVIADSFWHAKNALDAVEVTYDGGAENFSSRVFSEKLRGRISEKGAVVESTGDFQVAFTSAHSVVSATYEVPFIGHATMEPMNCTALFDGRHCTVWTGSQDAEWIARIAKKLLNIPLDDINVITPFLGGSFGRRSNNDYAIQAITLAGKFPGQPIKLIWTREEDLQHDFYRPNIVAYFEAGFDVNRNPVAFRHLNIGDGGQRQQGMIPAGMADPAVMASATQQPYEISHKSTEYLLEETPIPLGFWRSVGGAHNGFFIEAFIDEMAHAVGEDPVLFRRRLIQKSPRFLAVLDLVTSMANWRATQWTGDDGAQHAMGVALHEDHHTIVGEIADVSIDSRGQPRVHRVWCAVDCGTVVNPKIGAMQIESAVAFGLSAALMEKIEIDKGQVTNTNFHDYPIMRAAQMPEVIVEFIASDAKPTGLGEPGTPPIAAALCNALYTLTGNRIRTLPVGQLSNPNTTA